MLSAVLRFERSYPALPLARQLEHQRFTIPGPLVQRNNSLSFLHFFYFFYFFFLFLFFIKKKTKKDQKDQKCITPKKDRIRTVSQRTKPNSRTPFIGEQPNPWELLHPQDGMSRHRKMLIKLVWQSFHLTAWCPDVQKMFSIRRKHSLCFSCDFLGKLINHTWEKKRKHNLSQLDVRVTANVNSITPSLFL